jgi:hypothetical protein
LVKDQSPIVVTAEREAPTATQLPLGSILTSTQFVKVSPSTCVAHMTSPAAERLTTTEVAMPGQVKD